MALTENEHARLVEALADAHEGRLLAILQELEDQIASFMLGAPVRDGVLFDLAWALQARQDIERIMRETYLSGVDQFVRQYDNVYASTAELLGQYEAFVGVNDDVITNLKRLSFQGFQDVASTFVESISNEVYQNTLTGRPIADSVKNVRQKINGVYIASDQAEVERLVDIANAGGDDAEDAIKKLHQFYASDKTGNNMRKYARQMVNDSLMQFDASINVAAGKEAGATRWKYYGSTVRDSRQWCKDHAGQTYTEKEIRDMWANNDWAGKADGDPFIVRGGYNCRHHFVAVLD